MAHLTLAYEILVLLAVAREPWRYPIIAHAATDVIVVSLEPPLFHVAARRDVNCPVIRGEFHRARPWGTLRGVGKAETERENAARRRMMNGGVMVVSRAKPKYEWNGEEKYERKTARLEQGGRLGVACDSWFINVLSKKPLSPRGLPSVIPPALRPSSGRPPPFLLFIIIDTARLAGAIERRSRKSPTRFVFVAIQPGILHRSCHVQPYERCVLSSGRPFLERKFMSLAR